MFVGVGGGMDILDYTPMLHGGLLTGKFRGAKIQANLRACADSVRMLSYPSTRSWCNQPKLAGRQSSHSGHRLELRLGGALGRPGGNHHTPQTCVFQVWARFWESPAFDSMGKSINSLESHPEAISSCHWGCIASSSAILWVHCGSNSTVHSMTLTCKEISVDVNRGVARETSPNNTNDTSM